jgi:FAD/FMN-containing dehydrogenase
MSVATTISIPQLRAVVHGRVIVPGDPDYDETRVVMYDPEDAHPGVIIRAADVSDVVRAVALARETGLDLAVRCGGHSAASHSTVDGGIVLDLRDLRDIDIDVAGRSVWAGGGDRRRVVGGGRCGRAASGSVTRARRDRRDHDRWRHRLSLHRTA